jgi:putative flippase GtrA
MSKRVLRRLAVLVRSMGVGVFATATDLGVLALLVSGLGWSPRAASLPALLLGIVVQFLGNKLLAFDDRRPEWLRQGAQFMAVEALGFVANLVLFDRAMALTHLPYLPVRLATTSFVYFAICLPLWTRIFRTGARPLQGGAS